MSSKKQRRLQESERKESVNKEIENVDYNGNNEEKSVKYKVNFDLELKEEENETPNAFLLDLPLPRPSIRKLNENRGNIKLKNQSERNKTKIFQAEIDNIHYEGKSKETDYHASKYYAGVVNHERKEIKMIPVNFISVNTKTSKDEFNAALNETLMTMTKTGSAVNQLSGTYVNNDDTKLMGNYLHNKSLLTQDFGTSKSRKVIEQMKSTVVKDENISSVEAMHKIIMKNTEKQEEEAPKAKNKENDLGNLEAVLPKCNFISKNKMEMFDINSSKFHNT